MPETNDNQSPQSDRKSNDVLNNATTELYGALRQIASRQMSRERNGGLLQTTAIVHEAWFRLAKAKKGDWQNRSDFLAAASVTMRRVLVDQARQRNSAKRGGDHNRVFATNHSLAVADERFEIIDIHEALQRLTEISAEAAEAIGQVVFSGMTVDEIALREEVSKSTIERRLRFARAWMRRELLNQPDTEVTDER